MNYKIEKNIPISAHGKSGRWSILTSEMEIGDSILVETRKKATSICICLKRSGYKPVTRKVNGGIRVWKLEK